MLFQKIIEPAQKKWPAAIVLLLNKDETLRICVGYRQLSAIANRDLCPISLMDKRVDTFGKNALFFFTSNANIGY